jgi:hypothetical protein
MARSSSWPLVLENSAIWMRSGSLIIEIYPVTSLGTATMAEAFRRSVMVTAPLPFSLL